MASYIDGLTANDLGTLAGIAGTDPAGLSADLRRRPWAIHDLLSNPAVYDQTLDPRGDLSRTASPFLLFAILAHRAAGDLREATYVNDWSGPRSRLPVFDVAPLQEFVEDPGRLFFLVALLASFALPAPTPTPADPLDLSSMALWVDQAAPTDRRMLLRRLGDLALFMSGVFPDRNGAHPLRPLEAERLGRTVGMTAAEILALCDAARISPGLDALESLGARWYGAAFHEGGAPPVVADIAARFRSARRVLNHLADRYLYRLEPSWTVAA